MRQINRVNFYFALSHFDFNIRIKKKCFDPRVMAAVCEKEGHFVKRFFKVFARLDFHPRIMNIVYHVYVHMCTFFISSSSLPFACYRSSTPSNTFEESIIETLRDGNFYSFRFLGIFFTNIRNSIRLPYPIKREQFCKRGTSIALQYYCGTILLSL